MTNIEKTRVTLTLDKEAVDLSKAQGLNLSAIASDAIRNAAKQSEREAWIADNTPIIAAQDEWLEQKRTSIRGRYRRAIRQSFQRMTQFDVIDVQDDLGVIVESHLLAPDKFLVAIPLLMNYSAARLLNPTITVAYILATRLIAPIPKGLAKSTGKNVSKYRDEIIRAIDVMISGV